MFIQYAFCSLISVRSYTVFRHWEIWKDEWDNKRNFMNVLIAMHVLALSRKIFIVISLSRAEGLATEIKDLQGQLADYNTVRILVYLEVTKYNAKS